MTRRLFFMPGVGGDPDFWRPVGDLLPAARKKTFFGWPGLGNQPADPAIAGYNDLTALIESGIESGSGDEPVCLVAHSMGGVLALALAARHPRRIERLVLAVTSGGMDVGTLGARDWRPDYRREFPHVADWVINQRPDISADLGKVPQPTLLIWGDADPLSPPAVGEYLQNALPDARLHVVPGGQHDLARTHAADIAPLIDAHLD